MTEIIRRIGLAAALSVLPAVGIGGSLTFAGGDSYFHAADGAFLGVHIEEETEGAEGGARVKVVISGSAAEEAGLEVGDVIVGIDEDVVRGPAGLTRRIQDLEPGDRVALQLIRDGQRRNVSVELGERPGRIEIDRFEGNWAGEPFGEEMGRLHERLQRMNIQIPHGFSGSSRVFVGHRPRLGVQLTEATPELREHLGGTPHAGVLVTRVMPDMPAEDAGIHVGDLIVAVDGEKISDSADLIHALHEIEGGSARIEVIRDRAALTVDVKLPDRNDEDEMFDLNSMSSEIRDKIHRQMEQLQRQQKNVREKAVKIQRRALNSRLGV